MKFSVLQENLETSLSTLSRIIGSRTSLPVLANVLLVASKKGLEIQATNLELAMSCVVGAKIEKEGKLSVPARLLSELVHQLPKGKIQISSDKDNLTIQAESFTSTLNGIAASEFPEIPQLTPKATLKLKSASFGAALASVIVATSLDESRPVLAGVCIAFDKDLVTLAATDSYRLAENHVKTTNKYQQTIIVPLRAAQELLRLIQGNDKVTEVEFRIGASEVAFAIDQTLVVSQLIEGKYPDYTKIIPESSNTKVVVNRAELLAASRVSALFTQTGAHTISLNVKKDSVSLNSTAAHVGTNTSRIDGKTTGEAMEISLNAKYLLDVLSSVESQEVSLEFNSKLDPIIIRPNTKGSSYLHIIMPLRS